MKKAQLAIEFLHFVGMAFIWSLLFIVVSSFWHANAATLENEKILENECLKISSVSSSLSTKGIGSSYIIELNYPMNISKSFAFIMDENREMSCKIGNFNVSSSEGYLSFNLEQGRVIIESVHGGIMIKNE